METETIDKLFLELSQVTQARTAKEIKLEQWLARLRADVMPLLPMVERLDPSATEGMIFGTGTIRRTLAELDCRYPLSETP